MTKPNFPKRFPKKQTFKNWLTWNFETGDIVAEDWGANSCPIALFMKDNYNLEDAYFFYDAYRAREIEEYPVADNDIKKSPKWAHEFARKLDKAHSKCKGNDYKFPPVTAGYCLKILEDC